MNNSSELNTQAIQPTIPRQLSLFRVGPFNVHGKITIRFNKALPTEN